MANLWKKNQRIPSGRPGFRATEAKRGGRGCERRGCRSRYREATGPMQLKFVFQDSVYLSPLDRDLQAANVRQRSGSKRREKSIHLHEISIVKFQHVTCVMIRNAIGNLSFFCDFERTGQQ